MWKDTTDSLPMRSADRGRMEGAEKHAVNEGDNLRILNEHPRTSLQRP